MSLNHCRSAESAARKYKGPKSESPGVGLEPTSPGGHQLARARAMISRLTPFRVLNLPSSGTPAQILTS